ncbi:MAG TPA: hypothetical protein VLA13_08280, partial [Massilibacterium sp.]|nr:hypothetical protein [Massilibacterium sp.]
MKRMILFILLWFSISSQIILSQSNNWIRYCVGNTGLPDLAVHDLIQNSNGHYLIATQSGLAEFDGQIWTVYDTSNTDLTRLDVLNVAVTADNIIWIATSQSISGPIYPYFASFNGTQWSIYTDEDENILSSSISKILVGNSERVWFSTANGLLMYDGTFHSYKPSGDLWGP